MSADREVRISVPAPRITSHALSKSAEVAVGGYVTPEMLLGYVGTTGNATGTPPHLHFGVYTPRGAVNPLPLLADKT